MDAVRRPRHRERAPVLLRVHRRAVPGAARDARIAALAERARPRRDPRERAQRAGVPPHAGASQADGIRAVGVLRVVRGRAARAPPAGAGRGDLRPGREHPGAHHGGGRGARIGAGCHPRGGLHQEHRVVPGRRAAELPVPVPLRGQRHRADPRVVAAPRWARVAALQAARHLAAPGRGTAPDRGAVAHRRHRRRPRAAHRAQGEAARSRSAPPTRRAPIVARSGCTTCPIARFRRSTTSRTPTSP